MSADSQRLREERMVFYRDDMARIDAVMRELIDLSGARGAMLIDKDGHLVARTGGLEGFDIDTIAALVAGSFAATREMARLMGEKEFSVIFHQGQKDNIQLSLIGDRTILTVLFDERTTVGMVRLYATEASRKLAELFVGVAAKSGNSPEVDLGGNFAESAQDRLDSLFPQS